MSKTIKKSFYQKLTFEKLIQAEHRAAIGKKNKIEVIKYEMDLESNLVNLMREIKRGVYKQGKYKEFYVFEPKMRLIKSLSFRDRIVHQWYVEEFIKPYFLSRFINDSFACLENKGTHNAVYKLQKYMRIKKRNSGDYFILKCDVEKFFYNIDKSILFGILKSKMSDQLLIKFTENLLYSDDAEVGIPIGNYTSQFFANIYLNELDHYVKEKLKVKYYIRYMDDFILLLDNKNEAKTYLKMIEEFLKDRLYLKLNKKSCYFPNRLGVDFCGYKLFETHILIRKSAKIKIKRTIKK